MWVILYDISYSFFMISGHGFFANENYPNRSASFLECFIIRMRKHKRRGREKDFATGATVCQSERWSRTLESRRTPEKAEQYHFFVPSVSFLVKSPYVIFSISTSRSPVMVRFKILIFPSL